MTGLNLLKLSQRLTYRRSLLRVLSGAEDAASCLSPKNSDIVLTGKENSQVPQVISRGARDNRVPGAIEECIGIEAA